MPGIRIVTDSASDLPSELLKRHEIEAIPLEVRLAGVDPSVLAGASADEFWRISSGSGVVAETAAPSPGAFATTFERAKAEGADGVVCITISSALSATYQSAAAGTATLDGFPVEVVDSRLATMGEGLLVLRAAEAASAGADLAEVADAARGAIDRISVFGTLENLDALRRGGRIGSAQALIGSMLSIKPVIEVRDGKVEGESKQRTRGRSLSYLVEKVAKAGDIESLAVVHTAARDIEGFLDQLGSVYPRDQTIVTFIGPVIGAHTGVGTIGVCIRRR